MEDLIKKIINKVMSEIKSNNNRFIVEASARHVHLSQEDVEKLFGESYKLTFVRELSQPGQFLAKERVTLIGSKGIIENVAVLGPARDQTQVEISITDSKVLGVKSEIRESGKLENTQGIIIAANGNVAAINKGVIAAQRHIHMTLKDAENLGVKDKDIVKVKIHSKRPVILEDVLVRVSNSYNLSMHIDFDEANACALDKDTMGEIL